MTTAHKKPCPEVEDLNNKMGIPPPDVTVDKTKDFVARVIGGDHLNRPVDRMEHGGRTQRLRVRHLVICCVSRRGNPPEP